MVKLRLSILFVLFTQITQAQLIINELSQGPSGAKEYVELLVTGTPTCTNNRVDLRGWIIDDNNSWHASGSGVGIAPGHVKFDSIAQWTSVKIGSLIVIYNDADVSPAIAALTDDVNDANNDCVYVIPVSSPVLLKNTTLPASGGSMTTYAVPGTPYTTTGNWNPLGMANGGDAFHTVSPADYSTPYHAIGWGNNNLQLNAYFSNAQGSQVIYMANIVNNNPYSFSNYVEGNAATDETPGSPNNAANAGWIASLNNNCQPYTVPTTTRNLNLCAGQSVVIGGVTVTTAGTYTDTLPATIGCDTVRSNIVTVAPYVRDTQQLSTCPGQPVVINGQSVSTPGDYNDTLTAITGCDTIRIYRLSLLPYNTATQNRQLCPGQSTVINGQTITNAGTYLDTVPSTNGCDTIITYQVSILPYNTATQNIGLCTGQSVVINGVTVTTNGTYLDTVPSTNGCDTIVSYQVTFSNFNTATRPVSLCPGQSTVINGVTVSTAGNYLDTVASTTGGCDTIITYQVSVLPYQQRTQALSICPGDSVVINGQAIYTPGSYADTVATIGPGCDTVVTYVVSISGYINATENYAICPGETRIIRGNAYSNTGTFTDTVNSSTGCDTAFTYVIAPQSLVTTTRTIMFCQGETVVVNGTPYTTSTTFTDTVSSSTSCDTVITYTLTALPVSNTNVNATICQGETYFAGGALQTTAGIYTDTLTGSNGCDSIVTTNLSVAQPSTSTNAFTTCAGDVWNGITLTNDTVITLVLTNQNGCDSTITTTITVLPAPVAAIQGDSVINEGDEANLNATGGNAYQWSTGQNTAQITVAPVITTTYYVTAVAGNNCTATDSITVTVIPAPEIEPLLPTAFSPNGDNVNDVFNIVNRSLFIVDEFHIYNRWGELVFNSSTDGWDGTYKGVEQPISTFVYYARVWNLDKSKQYQLRGNVTLIR